jgi:murein DD-endopeptidase MepM/ murein hydrolase activator NlpD
MFDFLRDLFGRPGARTVILLDQDSMTTPRQYDVRPSQAIYVAVIAVVVLAAVLVATVVLTPLRGLVFGPGAEDLRAAAEENARRAEALEDSLSVQAEQMDLLRGLITGEIAFDDSTDTGFPPETAPPAAAAQPASPSVAPDSSGWEEASGSDLVGAAPVLGPAAQAYLGHLRLPALPPLDGILSRGFDAASGHFAVDIAARVGTPVRAIAAGYVVLADWSHDGGYTVAVQHPDGYLSLYKHNSRLLKRVGERVRTRETIALSGNTGQITSGPHLHLELWRDGLARDPAAFLLLP